MGGATEAVVVGKESHRPDTPIYFPSHCVPRAGRPSHTESPGTRCPNLLSLSH